MRRVAAIAGMALLLAQTTEAFPSAAFNRDEVHSGLVGKLAGSSLRDLGSRDLSLGDLVNGILNGSLPGIAFPNFNLPLSLGNIVLELPPVVAIGRKAIPDAQHPFQAPGPTDQRGGCPGLNIMANYGYINRTGVTTVTELLWAQQEMLGLAPDLAAILTGLGVLSAMDPTTLKLSIGNSDSRTNGPLSGILGQVPGLFDKAAHNTYELDGSVAYTDSAFSPDGNTNHFNSTKWATAVQIAQENGGTFGPAWEAALRYHNYNDCVHTNPSCSWEEKQLLFYAANGFQQTAMTSEDENGLTLPPTIEAMTMFFGVIDNGNGTYSKGAEQLPPSPDGVFYRRSVPLTFAELALLGDEAYLAHPVIFGTNSGEPNSFTGSPDQLGNVLTGPHPLCLVFTEIQDLVPGFLKPVQGAILGFSNMLLAPARLAINC